MILRQYVSERKRHHLSFINRGYVVNEHASIDMEITFKFSGTINLKRYFVVFSVWSGHPHIDCFGNKPYLKWIHFDITGEDSIEQADHSELIIMGAGS
jgi:hypothetical protein